MSAISSYNIASELPPILGDFVEACVANRLVLHAETLQSELISCFESVHLFDEDATAFISVTKDKSGKILSQDEVKAIREKEQKDKQEYTDVMSVLPPYSLSLVNELSAKYDTVKKIARIASKTVDRTLHSALTTRFLEPIEAVANCAMYIDCLAIKKEVHGIRLKFSHQQKSGGVDGSQVTMGFNRFLNINSSDVKVALGDDASPLTIRVKPTTEFYLLYHNRIYQIKMKEAELEGSKSIMKLNVAEWQSAPWTLSDEQLKLMQSQFDDGLVTKNTLMLGQESDVSLQIPAAVKMSSFIKPSKFWEEG